MEHFSQSPSGLGALSNRLRDRARAIHRELENSDAVDDHAWSALGRVYDLLGDPQLEQGVLERRVAAFTASGEMPSDAEPVYRLAELRLSQPETHSEGISYKPRVGEVGMCPQVGRMGPGK